MFFVAHFSIFFLIFRQRKFFLIFFFRILSPQGINSFHNAHGHYWEISPRQEPITARDFTGNNLCHIINSNIDVAVNGISFNWLSLCLFVCLLQSCIFQWPYHLLMTLPSSNDLTIFQWPYHRPMTIPSSSDLTIFQWPYHLPMTLPSSNDLTIVQPTYLAATLPYILTLPYFN